MIEIGRPDRKEIGRPDRKATASDGLRPLVKRYGLDDDASAKLSILLDLVVSDPLAPTSVHDPIKALHDHLADSLVALELVTVRSASAIADLGSGAGFPGLPLAIAMPGAAVALVESTRRKCAFVERAVGACELRNAQVVQTRAESWGDGLGRFDVVTARALAPLDVVAEYAAPLLRIGGTLVVWRGRRDPETEAAALAAADKLGLQVDEVRPVTPYEGAEHRHLHLMSKVMDTPESFPRRPGMATKRPLGRLGAPSDRSRR